MSHELIVNHELVVKNKTKQNRKLVYLQSGFHSILSSQNDIGRSVLGGVNVSRCASAMHCSVAAAAVQRESKSTGKRRQERKRESNNKWPAAAAASASASAADDVFYAIMHGYLHYSEFVGD